MLPPNTLHWKRNVVMMCCSQTLVMAGFAAAMPFVPLYMKDHLGLTDVSTRGFYVSLFNFFGMLAYGVFNPVWGTLSDRFGVKPMLLRGTFLTAVFFPMMAYVGNVRSLIALRFVTAACAGTTAASQTLLVKNTPEEKQGFALGMMTTAFWTGATLGNVLGGLVVHYYGYEKTFWFCGILYFVAGLFVLFAKDDYIPMRTVSRPEPEKPTRHYRPALLPGFTVGVWLLMLLTVLLGLAGSLEGPYVAMQVELITGGRDAAFWTGIISAAVAVGSMLSGALVGTLADRVAPLKLQIPIMILTAVTLLLQAGATDLRVFGVSRVLMYFVFGGAGAVMMKLLSNTTPKRKRGAVFGYRSTAHNIGGMLAAGLGGGLVYLTGSVRSAFYAAAVLTVLLIPVVIGIVRRAMNQPFYRAHSPFGAAAPRAGNPARLHL